MNPCENSAQCCFLLCGRKLCERALHSRHNFRSDAELETIFAEEGNQHRCSGGANNGVRSRIGWVWCGVATSGSQFGSAAVSGLLSVAAARMAVTGRQKL